MLPSDEDLALFQKALQGMLDTNDASQKSRRSEAIADKNAATELSQIRIATEQINREMWDSALKCLPGIIKIVHRGGVPIDALITLQLKRHPAVEEHPSLTEAERLACALNSPTPLPSTADIEAAIRCVMKTRALLPSTPAADLGAREANTAEARPGPTNHPKRPGKRLKEPRKQAFRAYLANVLMGKKQQDVANELGITSQAQVSRLVTQVRAWGEAGGWLPTLPGLAAQPQSIDPNIIEMGERQDGRTPRQRLRRDDK